MNFPSRLAFAPRFGIAGWTMFVAVLAFLPVFAFSVYLMWKALDEQQVQSIASLDRRADVAAAALAQELEGVAAGLGGIAQAYDARRGDLRDWHAIARRLVQADARLKSASLSDMQGRVLFHTDEPFGAALPESAAGELQPRLLDGGGPLVSPLLRSARTGERAVGVGLLVRREGEPPYVLRAELDLQRIGQRLNEQAWPADWTASVLDQRGVIVARSRDPEKFIGQPATEALLAGIAAGRPVFRADTRDGTEVIAAAAPVAGSGWHVAVGRPLAALKSQARRALVAMFAAGLFSAAIGMGAAWFAARHLRRQLARALRRHAPGMPATEAPSPLREFDQLAGSLREARAEATRQAQALHSAQLDALTGVAGRALFLHEARALLRDAQADADRALALAYVDLDGFKQVNDRLGHEAGDRILRAAAEALRASVRETDAVGRLGGDEFAVCMGASRTAVDGVGALAAARMVDAIGEIGESVGCSVGLAVLREGETLEQLLARADQAMREAKQAGKNRFQRAD
jgi:diguanylate cyclase (GGDEF)-like protein